MQRIIYIEYKSRKLERSEIEDNGDRWVFVALDVLRGSLDDPKLGVYRTHRSPDLGAEEGGKMFARENRLNNNYSEFSKIQFPEPVSHCG